MSRPKSKYAHGNRRLVGRVLKAEAGLKGYVPTPRPDGPPEPAGADELLAALSATYRPGDAVGLRQILDCIAVTQVHAMAVRRWAEHNGAWPYLRPGLNRPAAGSERRPKREGGDP
jgi:hypothetical protein